MNYISDGSAAIARAMERKLQMLSPEAAFIFISVSPKPEIDGICTEFTVVVGALKTVYTNSSTIEILVRSYLGTEFHADAIHLTVTVYFGIPGNYKSTYNEDRKSG